MNRRTFGIGLLAALATGLAGTAPAAAQSARFGFSAERNVINPRRPLPPVSFGPTRADSRGGTTSGATQRPTTRPDRTGPTSTLPAPRRPR